LAEIIDYFYVDAKYNKEGTLYNVFWYQTRPYDYDRSANYRKEFLLIDEKDWLTLVNIYQFFNFNFDFFKYQAYNIQDLFYL